MYEGLYAMSVRDFKRCATLFLDAISTFTSYELMDYVAFVEYTVYISMLALDRWDVWAIGYSDFNNLKVFTSNKLPNNILKNVC